MLDKTGYKKDINGVRISRTMEKGLRNHRRNARKEGKPIISKEEYKKIWDARKGESL